MDNNQYIIINDDSTISVKVNEFDVWSLVITEGNFMLDKYFGRGSCDTINVIGFTNLGDGVTGEIEFFVNNKRCYKGEIQPVKGDNGYFEVTPKYVTLNGEGSTQFVTVSSDGSWNVDTNETEFTITKETNGFTITSNGNGFFENLVIIVTNYDGSVEYVYVSQPSYISTNILIVNPKYISLNSNNKNYSFNVISLCDGSSNYYVDGILSTSTTVTSSITADEDTQITLTVTNDCNMSETVVIDYKKDVENEHYLWVGSSGNTTTSYTFENNSIVNCNVLSSSNWRIKSYDSNFLNCTKNGNIINISLNQNNLNEFNNKVITLINNDGDIATITCSSSVKINEDEIIFTFTNGETEISVTTDDNYSFKACIFAYKNVNGSKQPISWKNKSSNFKITNGDSQNGGADTCKEVTFSATTSTQTSLLTSYIVTLQEQDSYNEIKIKVTVDRSKQAVEDGYRIEIAPESGVYSNSETSGFTVTVTPTYIYDGVDYHISDNYELMKVDGERYIEGYRGVSAETSFNGGVTLITSETLYDSIVYVLDIPESVTSFTACTTATTASDESQTCDSCTACTEITISAVTETFTCEFRTDTDLIEVGYESTSVSYMFISNKDGECVEYEPTYVSGDENWRSWLTVDDSDCESVTYSFSENEDFDDREVTLKFKQVDGCSNDEITVSFKQYGNGTIFIPNFDYLVVRYFWEGTAGTDLDTVTLIPYFIKKDGSEFTSTNYFYLDDGVGYGHDYTISGDSGVYIAHAGDNTGNGNECVYLNFKNLCSESELEKMMDDGIEKIRVDLYGVWFNTKGTGDLDVSLIAYREGEMIKDPSDTFNFVNSGGVEVYNDIRNAKVCAYGSGKASTFKTDYTPIGYVEYNIKNKGAMLTLHEECEESQYVLSRTSASSVTIPYQADTHTVSFNSSKDGNVFTSVTATDGCDWVTVGEIGGTSNPLSLSYTVTKNETEDTRLCLITLTQSESNKTINYQIKQSPNTSRVCNHADVTYYTVDKVARITYASAVTSDLVVEVKVSNNNNTLSSSTTINVDNGETTKDISFGVDFVVGYVQVNSVTPLNDDTFEYNCDIDDYIKDSRDSCMTITYELQNINETIDVYYKANGTQQGSHSVSSNGSQSLCNIASDTVLQISCSDNDVTSSPSYITYRNGTSEIIILSKPLEKTDNCATLEINQRNWTLTLPYEATSNVIFTFNATNGFSDENGNIGDDWTQTITIASGSKTGTARSTTTQFATNASFVSVSPSEDDTYKYCYDSEGLGVDDYYELSASGTTIDPPAPEANVYIKSLKNGSPYPTFTFEESCDWVSNPTFQSSSTTGVYNYQFSTQPNSSTDTRRCTVTVKQTNGKETTFDIVQNATVIEEPCYSILIELDRDNNVLDYSFTPDTQIDLTFKIEFRNSSGDKINDYYIMLPQNFSGTNGGIPLDWNCSNVAEMKVVTLNNNSDNSYYDPDLVCSNGISYRFVDGRYSEYYFSFSDTSEKTTKEILLDYPNDEVFDVTIYSCYGSGYNVGIPVGYTFTMNPELDNGPLQTNSCEQGDYFDVETNNGVLVAENGTITFYQDVSGKELNLIWRTEPIPIVTGFKVANNQPGVAKIQMKDINNNVIPILDSNGIPQQRIELANGGAEQTFGSIFTATTTINIEYESGKWSTGTSSFVAATFEGTNLEPTPTVESNVDITELGIEGFYVYAKVNDSCSATITCRCKDYYIYVNFIFIGYSA